MDDTTLFKAPEKERVARRGRSACREYHPDKPQLTEEYTFLRALNCEIQRLINSRIESTHTSLHSSLFTLRSSFFIIHSSLFNKHTNKNEWNVLIQF